MGKLKSLWVGFGIALGTIAAAISIFLLRSRFIDQAHDDIALKKEANESVEAYDKALKERADELSAMKADEVVSAFHKAFGGKA